MEKKKSAMEISEYLELTTTRLSDIIAKKEVCATTALYAYLQIARTALFSAAVHIDELTKEP